MTVISLIGLGELFGTGECAEIPPVVWSILFGFLTVGTGMAVEEFFEQLVRCLTRTALSLWVMRS